MKKTFKVKNILKNKNKYNFKTELLLSALSLLVAFGTVSCKKDPVKPKQKTEKELKKEAIEKQKQLVDAVLYRFRHGALDSAKFVTEDATADIQEYIDIVEKTTKNVKINGSLLDSIRFFKSYINDSKKFEENFIPFKNKETFLKLDKVMDSYLSEKKKLDSMLSR